MPSALDRIDMGPPRDEGAIRSFGLALLIHAALIAALTWGVNWKRSDSAASFDAEIWTSVPAEATPNKPAPAEALPLPLPPPAPQPALAPPPEPPRQVDIALEQDKKRKLLKEQQVAQEKALQLKAAQLKAEQLKAEQLKAEQLAKAERAEKADKAKADALKNQQTQQAQQSADKQRDDNLKRLNDLMAKAGGGSQGQPNNASAGGKGNSNTYDAIANAAIMPNVVFTETDAGNPVAVVEVRVTLDGTIISTKLMKSSGNKNWDNAVISGLIRTRVMPKDITGKVPDTIFILSLRPRY